MGAGAEGRGGRGRVNLKNGVMHARGREKVCDECEGDFFDKK